MSARVRGSEFYTEQVSRAKAQHPGLTSEQYDSYALRVYEHIADVQGVATKRNFIYLGRLRY